MISDDKLIKVRNRANGSVGGEITKRLVKMGEQHLGGSSYQTK